VTTFQPYTASLCSDAASPLGPCSNVPNLMELATSLASVLRGDAQKVLEEVRHWTCASPALPVLNLATYAAPLRVPSPPTASSLPGVDDFGSLLEQCFQTDAGPPSLWQACLMGVCVNFL
jgi:hypothetical protein